MTRIKYYHQSYYLVYKSAFPGKNNMGEVAISRKVYSQIDTEFVLLLPFHYVLPEAAHSILSF